MKKEEECGEKVPLTKQRSFRIPVELAEWIDKLGPEYGITYNARVMFVLYRGKKRMEREIQIIEAEDAQEPLSKVSSS